MYTRDVHPRCTPHIHPIYTLHESILSALLGLSPVIILGESFAGILVGGRTGLTAIFTGLLFLVVLPFAPIFTAIPLFASAPVREE